MFTGQSYTSVPGVYNIAYLAKTKSNGDSVWTREIYPILPDSGVVGLSVFEVNSNLFLLGGSEIIFMYDSNGTQIWRKKMPLASFYQILDFVNGEIVYTTGSKLQKIDTTGLLKWSIDFPNFIGTKKVIRNHNFNFCYLYTGIGGTYYREVTRSGQIIRDQLFGIGSNVATGILIQDAQLNYVVIHSWPVNFTKFDTSLNILQDKIIGVAGNNSITSIEQTIDNGYIIVGQFYNGDADISFLKTDKDGNKEYFNFLPRWFYDEYPVDIHVDADGGFVVFGNGGLDEPNYSDYLLIKTNSDATLGIPFMPEKRHFELILYPNPSRNKIIINTSFPITGALKVIDLAGKLVAEKKIQSESYIDLDIEELKSGFYLVQIIDQLTYITLFQKFIKQ